MCDPLENMYACSRGTAPDKAGLEMHLVPLLAFIQAGPGCYPTQQDMNKIFGKLDTKHKIFAAFSDTAKGHVLEMACDTWRTFLPIVCMSILNS